MVIKHYKIIILIFIIVLPIAFYGYTNTEVYYNLDKSLPKDLASVTANNDLKETFNMVSMELLLVDKNIPESKINAMLDEIEALDRYRMDYSDILNSQILEFQRI